MRRKNYTDISSSKITNYSSGSSSTTFTNTSIVNYSSSNFINHFIKFCFTFVLIVMLGSFFINGYNALDNKGYKIKENITHEYQNIIGYDYNSDFSFASSIDDLFNVPLYFLEKPTYETAGVYISLVLYYERPVYSYLTAFFDDGVVVDYSKSYTINNNNAYAFNFIYTNSINLCTFNIGSNRNGLSSSYDFSSKSLFDFYNKSWDDVINFENFRPYIILNNNTMGSLWNDYFFKQLINFLSNFFYHSLIPVYGSSVSYSYNIEYTHYDWSFKLNQLSNFKPLFYSQLFKANIDNLNVDLQNALEVIQRKVYEGKIVYGNNVILDINKPFQLYTGLYTKDLYGPFWSKDDRQVITSNAGKFVLSHYTYNDDKVLMRRVDNINDTYEEFLDSGSWQPPQWLRTIIGVITFPIIIVQNFFYDLGVFFNFLIVW